MMTGPIYLLRQNDSFYWSYRSHGRMTRSICLARQNDLEIKKKKITLWFQINDVFALKNTI